MADLKPTPAEQVIIIAAGAAARQAMIGCGARGEEVEQFARDVMNVKEAELVSARVFGAFTRPSQ